MNKLTFAIVSVLCRYHSIQWIQLSIEEGWITEIESKLLFLSLVNERYNIVSGGKPKYREKAASHEEFSATTVTSWRHHSSGAVLESRGRGRGCWGRDLADHVGHSHTRTSALHWPVSTLPHFLVILLPRLLRCSRVDHPLCRGGSGYQSTAGFNFQPLQPWMSTSFKNRAVFGSPMCLVGNFPLHRWWMNEKLVLTTE